MRPSARSSSARAKGTGFSASRNRASIRSDAVFDSPATTEATPEAFVNVAMICSVSTMRFGLKLV